MLQVNEPYEEASQRVADARHQLEQRHVFSVSCYGVSSEESQLSTATNHSARTGQARADDRQSPFDQNL